MFNSLWLYNIARGIDLEAVMPRMTSKSIGCCKKFPGRNAIIGMATLTHWLHELAKEICDRLEQDELENNRRPKQLVVSFMQTINGNDVSSSRSVNLATIEEEKIVNDALDALKRNTEKFFKSPDNCHNLNNPIKFLGLSVGKFETQDTKRGNTIQDMFKKTIDSRAKNDETVETVSTINDETAIKCDKPLVKKSFTIQDMFRKSTESSISNDGKGEEKPEGDKEDSINQGSTKLASPRQSFFANLKLSKPAVPREEGQVKNDAIAETATEEPDSENDDNLFQTDELLKEMVENEQTLSRMRAPSPVASTSKVPDYMQTYAEFYRPPPNIETPKEKCSQCNKMISVHELQVHTDGHFAFQLCQEQRVEFQSQLQTSTSTAIPTPPAKKMKISKPTTATSNSTFSIDKFLVKKDGAEHNESVADCSTAIHIATEICTECSKAIPITDIFEHMDYHAAKKLHDELLKSESVPTKSVAVETRPKTASTSSSKGNKSKKKINNISNNKNNNYSMKSIATFFDNT